MLGKLRSRWRLLFWLVFSLAYFYPACPSAAEPQTGPELATWPPSTLPLRQTVTDTNARMKILLQRLSERNQEVKSLRLTLEQLEQQGLDSTASYAELSGQLRQAEISRDSLSKEVTEISSSRERLQQDYNAQKSSSDNYREEANLQIREIKRERNGWRLAGIGGILVAIAALIYSALK
jgi:predicted RNase H-like nuclease (RuvC/YqgF family)